MSDAARSRAPLATFADVAALDPDARPGELVRGAWAPVTRNTWNHGVIVGNLCVALKLWARATPGWSVSVGDPGAKLAREPDVLRGPDVGIVHADRVPTGRGEAGWLEGAPDVAVEVVGDAQSVSDTMEKALDFIRGGARRVWIVDPGAERVLVVTPPDHVRVIGANGELDGEDVLPGFRCPVSELFVG
jgi:Uma2 family endonuclease